MNTAIKTAIIAAFFVLSTNLIAGESKAEKIRPNIIGKTYLFDYGDYAYDITISSDKTLHWKLVKGSFKGPDNGGNPYLLSKIADGIIFLSWKEESGMQFFNVMNLKTGKLTTHANAEGMFVNMGTVSLKK